MSTPAGYTAGMVTFELVLPTPRTGTDDDLKRVLGLIHDSACDVAGLLAARIVTVLPEAHVRVIGPFDSDGVV